MLAVDDELDLPFALSVCAPVDGAALSSRLMNSAPHLTTLELAP
jgi:hypothetical protein